MQTDTVETSLARHKQEGTRLAVRSRWIALFLIAVLLPFLNPQIEVIYYQSLLALLALTAYFQLQASRTSRGGLSVLLLFIDVLLMTLALILPNPFDDSTWPTAMTFRFDSFLYFFVLLSSATLMYSWRTIAAVGLITGGVWAVGVFFVVVAGQTFPEMTAGIRAAFQNDLALAGELDPNSVKLDHRAQEIVVFLIVSLTLAVSVRRFEKLLQGNAVLERQRANLSRYFSPNVVDALSQRDGVLGEEREQRVAVLFVDLVGFTRYASKRQAQEVIATLRLFHGRMEACVFRNDGTLDKYLGDGLMATFGTPFTQPDDVARAMRCAQDMLEAMDRLNAEWAAAGREALRISIGLHVGPVAVGDIGSNRLEFAVIGNTVNIASRLEALTRSLGTRLVISDAACEVLDEDMRHGLRKVADQQIKGVDEPITVWTAA